MYNSKTVANQVNAIQAIQQYKTKCSIQNKRREALQSQAEGLNIRSNKFQNEIKTLEKLFQKRNIQYPAFEDKSSNHLQSPEPLSTDLLSNPAVLDHIALNNNKLSVNLRELYAQRWNLEDSVVLTRRFIEQQEIYLAVLKNFEATVLLNDELDSKEEYCSEAEATDGKEPAHKAAPTLEAELTTQSTSYNYKTALIFLFLLAAVVAARFYA